jgi:hypothetical protein
MNSTALIMYLSANIIVTAFTVYYFYKVLTIPPRNDHDDHQGPKTFDAT